MVFGLDMGFAEVFDGSGWNVMSGIALRWLGEFVDSPTFARSAALRMGHPGFGAELTRAVVLRTMSHTSKSMYGAPGTRHPADQCGLIRREI
jgi:hypothetical protein